MKDLFRGELVRLTAEEPETVARAEARWQRDSEFVRLADSDPWNLSSEKKIKERVEKRLKRDPSRSGIPSLSAPWLRIS